MTVAELIEFLKEIDSNLEVVFTKSSEGKAFPINTVSETNNRAYLFWTD